MKKLAFAILTGVMLLTTTAFAETDIKIKINGEELACDPPAIVENDRLLVPMRAIFEKLEAQVNWDEETQTITAAKDSFILLMQVENTKMFLNGEEILLEASPVIVDNHTMVPARAVSDAFKIPVEWDDKMREVLINY